MDVQPKTDLHWEPVSTTPTVCPEQDNYSRFQKISVTSVKINVIILDAQGSWENEALLQMYVAQNKMKMTAPIFSRDCGKVTTHLSVWCCLSRSEV